ncbi:tRNA pseudouridine(55) synthase TruB [Glycomyces luteolus]|uniref:tRNA pseudouridine synthase B n=1 Tax=Glycomyces luteolus TaxID=2670330 RepID=A0A9X3P3E7_9ACTN|nr:tRNA pseudouridine(55) synthase TruB [Glycomyces luteolus]MDA1357993.1 tRNA pseudouridine(55) synthase TruB [Glycomyces luteolus]
MTTVPPRSPKPARPVEPGLIVVDKPQGITSHGVVSRMRRICGTRKVGHGGTLDPMATGVLIVAIGKATKLLTYVSGLDKSYAATIRLGQATVTDDAEGEVTASVDASAVADAAIRDGLAAMTGEIDQVPSAVSAVKIDGQRAYKRVREGETVELKARRVTIASIEVGAIRREGEFVDVDVDVSCSSGTYIRAIARDLGSVLGVGGHLTALRRTRIGGFGIDTAATLETLSDRSEAGEPLGALTMGEAAARLMPTRTATEAEAKALSYGKPLDAAGIEGRYAVLSENGDLLAVMTEKGDKAKPETVFAAAN